MHSLRPGRRIESDPPQVCLGGEAQGGAGSGLGGFVARSSLPESHFPRPRPCLPSGLREPTVRPNQVAIESSEDSHLLARTRSDDEQAFTIPDRQRPDFSGTKRTGPPGSQQPPMPSAPAGTESRWINHAALWRNWTGSLYFEEIGGTDGWRDWRDEPSWRGEPIEAVFCEHRQVMRPHPAIVKLRLVFNLTGEEALDAADGIGRRLREPAGELESRPKRRH